jgi:hypothetical protein
MHGKPVMYAISLQQLLHRWYKDLVIENGNDIDWSSILNCQKSTHKTIASLGLRWPEKYPEAGDITAYVLNLYIKGK